MSIADQIIEQGPFPADRLRTLHATSDELNELRDELITRRGATTYDEWRVTGTCDGHTMNITWSPTNAAEPEADARAYIRAQTYAGQMRKRGTGWTDGPHLHKHTVTVTDWTEVDA